MNTATVHLIEFGADKTKCCEQPPEALPLKARYTTDAALVTCIGTVKALSPLPDTLIRGSMGSGWGEF